MIYRYTLNWPLNPCLPLYLLRLEIIVYLQTNKKIDFCSNHIYIIETILIWRIVIRIDHYKKKSLGREKNRKFILQKLHIKFFIDLKIINNWNLIKYQDFFLIDRIFIVYFWIKYKFLFIYRDFKLFYYIFGLNKFN